MSNGPFYLHSWSLGVDDDGFTAPEAQCRYLVGERDGKTIQTSAIVDVDGKTVYTRNSVYILMDPHPEYVAWMKEKKFAYDPEQPIRIVNKYSVIK